MASSDGSIGRFSALARSLASALTLSGALVLGSLTPAEARGARGGGGAYRGGGAARAGSMSHSRPTPPSRPTTSGRTANINHSGNRNVNVNSGNRTTNVNIDRSRDVNIQRNTAVVAGGRPYSRAPYAYGGRRYYAHNSYAYHRYRGYGWGGAYRPWGAFVATVAATAVIVSIANQQYRYDQGVWYLPSQGGYAVVTAPIGGVVTVLPTTAVVVSPSLYYYGGTYYEQTGSEYKVVAPVAGTVVEHLPEGGEEVTVGEHEYVKVGETYYQPIKKDGRDMYEVVEVK
jgi:hypothetical protein